MKPIANFDFLESLKKAVTTFKEAQAEAKEQKKEKKQKVKVTKDMLIGDKEAQDTINELIPSVEGINKEFIKKIKEVGVSKKETKVLVDNYYQLQEKRLICEGQLRSAIQESDNTVGHELLSWSYNQMRTMEKGYQDILDAVSKSSRVGRWLREIKGIGPTLAAALVAYFDIDKATSAGAFWSYAGLNDNISPKMARDKAKQIVEACIKARDGVLDEVTVAKVAQATGRKASMLLTKSTNEKGKINKDDLIKAVSYIPYNKDLKVICWKCSQQFVKVANRDSLYGKIYAERKLYETIKNENKEYANQAKMILGEDYQYDPTDFAIVDEEDIDFYKEANDILRSKNYSKSTDAYKELSQGKLPKAQIQARAERYAVKLFISHLFEMMYYDKYGKKAPNPFVIEHMGHKDYIEPEVPYDFEG